MGEKSRRPWLQMALANWKPIMAVMIPLFMMWIPLLEHSDRANCGYMIVVMALFWVLEVLPLPVTSLIPVALCPLMGILSTNDVSMQYMKSTMMLLLGSKVWHHRIKDIRTLLHSHYRSNCGCRH